VAQERRSAQRQEARSVQYPIHPAARRFVDSVVIVTGGANGLGRGIVERFVAEGAAVWIADVDERVAAVAGEVGAQGGVRCDVTDAGAVAALVASVAAERGRLDVMVANAGIAGGAPIADLDDDLYRRILAVNLDGVFHACRAAARAMVPARRGSIVTVSSVFGRESPAGSAAYGAAKAGVIALTQSLARELAPHGIRANSIAPGHMMTELYERAVARRAARAGLTPEAVFAEELAQVPMGRFGTGADVAGLVAFLASEDAGYVTGQTINVDGGLQTR
jgi:NAD(P)-dependent dehydrogenase (short-subunit alcohol dehydrogenase family)